MTQAPPPEPTTSHVPPSPRKRWALKIIFKWLLVAAVLSAIGRHIWTLTDEWRGAREADGGSLHLAFGWVGIAAVVYLLGLGLCGEFWRTVLAEAGLRVGRLELLRAYYVGHLGKYIPGKAMVVVLRAGLIRHGSLGAVRVGLTVIFETLAMMAIGALVAAGCLLIAEPARWHYWGGATGMAVVLFVVVHPAVFGRLSHWISLPFDRNRSDVTSPPRYGSLMRGGGLLVVGWVLLGLSLAATGRAIGLDLNSVDDLLVSIGTAALATVAGFLVIFMPSGIGVRELIVIELLAPRFGPSAAVGMSILLRLIWVVAELGVAGVLYKWPMRTAKD